MASREELTEQRNSRFLALLKPIHADCQRWAYHLAQNADDAEDILAQSILSALEHLHLLKNERAFKTWMFRIIHNHYRLWIRRLKREPEPVDPEVLPLLGGHVEGWVERSEMTRTLKRALRRLSPDQCQMLVLFEVLEFSIREISEVLGKHEVAVRVTLSRARDRMRVLLEQEGVSPPPSGMEPVSGEE
jgi:RNA polymerase sigma-70 factor (ECF subfamily)